VAFKTTILGVIENELDQTDPNITIWHAQIAAPLALRICYKSQAGKTPSYTNNETLVLSKHAETSSGHPHIRPHTFTAELQLWGFHGLIMQQAAHRLNVTKWEAEKKEKADKAAEETRLQQEVRALRGQVSALTEKIVALESANAA
jgi:hypothetical protein